MTVPRPDDLDDADVALLDALAGIVTDGTDGRDRAIDVDAPLVTGSRLTARRLSELLDAQLASRHLDRAARWLRTRGEGFYTIGSAGHEANALVAAALRPTDPALLHYRSGGFYLARAQQVAGHDGVADVLSGLLALRQEPISGGRHKVFGHHALAVIPQTSTIASHLPRAVGVAFAIERARRLGLASSWPSDAIAVCSFGDASLNHSTAQGALNTAGYTAYQGMRLPLLFVCEDNGLGISVATPPGWVEASLRNRPGLDYAHADGTDPVGVYETASALAAGARERGRPGLLHVRVIRYGGHAGTDVEAAYRSPSAVRADRAADPIVAAGRMLVQAGATTPAELEQRALMSRLRVRATADTLRGQPRLTSAGDVMAPLAPRRPDAVAARVAHAIGAHAALPPGLTLAESINHTLAGLLAVEPDTLVFGEDVAAKGGVYGVTRGLQKAAGSRRVFDTLLDEQSILGLALGMAVSGLVPIPEIQYLAYVHNAIDQLRGEGATLSFFSNGQYRNGMVVRIAGYGYQAGFGGHFHNDNSLGGLRDLPGVVVASPATGADAAAMLRTCAAAATVDGTVSFSLEPIARYHTRDLHQPGDGGWSTTADDTRLPLDEPVAIGSPRLARGGGDVAIVTWANGVYLSLRVAERVRCEGIDVRVVDLRWLAPLPGDELLALVADVDRVVVVDETRHTGGVGEAVVAALVERGYPGRITRVAARDSFVPLGDAANLVLVSEADSESALR
ncbi:thiamine pyrophosphate-dependent enzyme [soil metagenome]